MKRFLRAFLPFVSAVAISAADLPFTGGVTAVRFIRHLDQHPGSSELWEP